MAEGERARLDGDGRGGDVGDGFAAVTANDGPGVSTCLGTIAGARQPIKLTVIIASAKVNRMWLVF